MNEQLRKDILAWAQQQVDAWQGYEEDWWCAYDNKWDINIWDSDVYGEQGDGFGVSAYLIVNGGEDTDFCDPVRIGFVQRTFQVTE